MKRAIGLFEFKSIAKGIEVTDAILKSAQVTLVNANPICPGKYISIVTGEVAAVKNAVETCRTLGGIYLIEAELIANVHADVLPALTGTADLEQVDSVGVIETMSALNSIIVGDVAVKAANVRLLEIRLARGLGGKGFTIITGELSSVEKALQAAKGRFLPMGDILYAALVPRPHKDLVAKLFT